MSMRRLCLDATPHLLGSKGNTTKITLDAKLYRGVMLDKIEAIGPRGGKMIGWRAANRRNYQFATWSDTMTDAATR